MAKFFTTLLKLILYLALLAVPAVGAYFLSNYMGWDWRWGVPIVETAVIALVAAVILGRSLYYRYREEGFVKRVIEQDEASLAGGPMFERRQLQDIETKFKDASLILKRSHVKKSLRDPMYALPLYMMMGMPGSGKTTALKNSRLPTSFPELGHPSGEEVTNNVDWWFFNDCVFLDTSGRYVSPTETERDKEEWKKILSQLDKYRKKEPINGLVITVPADRLNRENADEMAQYGLRVHLRIDQLMRVMGARFPIYILITKADRIMGMQDFARILPWKAYKQSIGHINRKITQDSISFMDEALTAITGRLRKIRLHTMKEDDRIAPSVLLLPNEISAMRPALAAFVNGVFKENPYQEPPIFRGIFMSSARQEGEARADTLSELDLGEVPSTELPGTNRGLFLQDFMAKALPDDRNLHSHIQEFLRWRTSTRAISLIALGAITFLFLSLMASSFVRNHNAMSRFQEKFVEPPTIEGDITKDIIKMNSFSREIVELQKNNMSGYLPDMWLDHSKEEEDRLKEYYVEYFEGALLDRIDGELQSRVAGFDSNTPDIQVAQYIEHLVKRINIIKAYLKGATIDEQTNMPQPTTAVLLLIEKNLLPQVASQFSRLYVYNLNWKKDVTEIENEKENLEAMLVRLIELKEDNMSWLAVWASSEEDLSPVTLSMFWDDKIDDASRTGALVRPAFTVEGKKKIDDFIVQLRTALDDKSVLEVREPVFKDWYGRRYIDEWKNFGQDMIEEEEKRRSKDEVVYRARSRWQQTALRMTSFSNPYFNFLDMMAVEMDLFKNTEYAPGWLSLTINFQAMKAQVLSEGFVEEGLAVARSVTKGAETALRTEPRETKKGVQNQLQAVEELKAYQKALQDTGPVLRSKDHAYQIAVELFQSSAQISQSSSPFYAGYMAVNRMRALIGKNPAEEDLFWDLLEGPLNSLLYYTTREAACSLQLAWEEQVLAEVQGVPEKRMQTTLFGEEGTVWKFVEGPLKPFIGRNEKGYYAKEAYGQEVPFLDSFYAFLREGAIGRKSFQDEYEVALQGLPVDINEGAADRVEAVIVEMLCSDGVQRFENYNYPMVEVFKWSPEQCGGVKMEIVFRDFTLTRVYPNYTGFPEFLKDFRRGVRVFTPPDFPSLEERMKKARVNEVIIKMGLAGHEPVIELIERTPLTAPHKIVYCWN